MKSLRKIIMIMAVCAVAFAVTSCGKDEGAETPTQTPESTQTVAPEVTEAPTQAPTEEVKKETQKPTAKPTQKPTQAPAAATEKPAPVATQAPVKVTADTAAAYIGRSTSALVAAIGQPSGKTYATSCIGDGDDGEWYYPGFTVYTYRDPNGSERVEDVLAN